jgi:hypothetical protein
MAVVNQMYGSLSTLDLLRASYQSVAQFGEDRAWQAIEATLAAHNKILATVREDLMETTTDRLRRYGAPSQMKMDEIDEYGTPDAQKMPPGQPIGFPLRKYGIAIQWTRTYFTRMKAAELAAQVTGAMDADVYNLTRALKRAVFYPTNYTFDDRLVDHLQQITLPVKALVNADSQPLPVGPNGEFFDPTTHTHYLGVTTGGTLVNADLATLLSTVIEHYASGQAYIYINQAQEAAVRAFADFTPVFDPRLIVAITTTTAAGPLDMIQVYNRKIGIFRGAEVWVKPWIPASYVFAFVKGQPKPLVYRVDPDLASDLTLSYEDEAHPLRARIWERNFGVGVWNRTNGACMYVGATTYTQPTIN